MRWGLPQEFLTKVNGVFLFGAFFSKQLGADPRRSTANDRWAGGKGHIQCVAEVLSEELLQQDPAANKLFDAYLPSLCRDLSLSLGGGHSRQTVHLGRARFSSELFMAPLCFVCTRVAAQQSPPRPASHQDSHETRFRNKAHCDQPQNYKCRTLTRHWSGSVFAVLQITCVGHIDNAIVVVVGRGWQSSTGCRAGPAIWLRQPAGFRCLTAHATWAPGGTSTCCWWIGRCCCSGSLLTNTVCSFAMICKTCSARNCNPCKWLRTCYTTTCFFRPLRRTQTMFSGP